MALTPVKITGYEPGPATLSANGGGIFDTLGGNVTTSTTYKRTGSRALRFYVSGSAAGAWVNYTTSTLGTSKTYEIGSAYVMWHTWPSGDAEIFGASTAAAQNCSIYFDTSEKKIMSSVGSTPQTNSVVWSLDTWYRIDWKIYCGGTTWTIDVQVDGTASTQATSSESTSSFTTAWLGWINSFTGEMFIDDYILSVTGTDTYPIGAHTVVGISPNNGSSSSTPGTVIEDDTSTLVDDSTNPAYVELDEVPFGTTTDYIKQDGTGTYFAETALADITNNTVLGAMGYLAYTSSNTSANSADTRIRDGAGQETSIFTGDMSETSLFYKSKIITTPAAGWSKTTVDALTARVGYATSVGTNPYWQTLMVEVALGAASGTDTSTSKSAYLEGVGQGTSSSKSAYTKGLAYYPPTSIININHETGDTSQYTNVVNADGDLTIVSTAAMAGTKYGMSCLVNDTTAFYGYKTLASPSTTGILRFHIYIDPNDITISSSEIIYAAAFDSSDINLIFNTGLGYSSGYTIRAYVQDDSSGDHDTSTYSITNTPHYVEILVIRASTSLSSNGSLSLWIDGTFKETLSGIDNYDKFNNFGRLYIGKQDWVGTGSGTYYLDEVIVNDTGQEISSYPYQHVYLEGETSTSASTSKSAYIKGTISTVTNKDVYLKGQASIVTSKSGYTKGLSTSLSNKSVFIQGKIETIVSKPAYLSGLGEILVPISDIYVGSWKNEVDGTVLYPSVADSNDATYAWYQAASGGEYFEVKLASPVGVPTTGNRHFIWRAYRKEGTESLTVKCELRQGSSTSIASDTQILTDSVAEYMYILTSGEAANITDYTDLRLRITIMAVS